MNVGSVKYDQSIENDENLSEAIVWKQYPPYKEDKKTRLGSYIDLWVTTDSSKLPKDTTGIKDTTSTN